MLFLSHLSLVHFRNYTNASFDFQKRVAAFCGMNGIGKTNLLDAIYYLCFTKSYFSKSDQVNVKNGFEGMRLHGVFKPVHEEKATDASPLDVVCILRETGKKEFLLNEERYDKFSAHIGKFPCVIIAPDDVQMITGNSEERRRLLDSILSQLDHDYLLKLIDYQRILQQRNSMLRSAAETGSPDLKLLDVYDRQLAEPGDFIFRKRKTFLENFLPEVNRCYHSLAGFGEPVELKYQSQLLESDMASLLKQYRQKDLLLQRTNAGIHKDDIEICFDKQPFKQVASQGQRKSLLFALKLAEFDILEKEKGYPPLLLLDDVFEKLDEERLLNLLERVCVKNTGQVFITDTHAQRVQDYLGRLKVEYQLIELGCQERGGE